MFDPNPNPNPRNCRLRNMNNGAIHGDNILIRALADIVELEVWSQFCSQCFSHKPSPPSAKYFQRHFTNDPDRDLGLIYIAVSKTTNKIISSLRLFRRRIFQVEKSIMQRQDHEEYKIKYHNSSFNTDNDESHHPEVIYVECVGIGEVCTHVDYRRQGLSSMLLNFAFSQARRMGYEHAFLHAAEWIKPMYEQHGFRTSSVTWINLKISQSDESIYRNWRSSQTTSWTYSHESSDIFKTPMELSNMSSVQNSRFNGCILRSEEYISSWLSGESASCSITGSFDSLSLSGYVIFQNRGSHAIRMQDAVAASHGVFWDLVFQGVCRARSDFDLFGEEVTVLIPWCFLESIVCDTFVALHSSKRIRVDEVDMDIQIEFVHDDGWMVASLDPVSDNRPIIDLIWPIDSF